MMNVVPMMTSHSSFRRRRRCHHCRRCRPPNPNCSILCTPKCDRTCNKGGDLQQLRHTNPYGTHGIRQSPPLAWTNICSWDDLRQLNILCEPIDATTFNRKFMCWLSFYFSAGLVFKCKFKFSLVRISVTIHDNVYVHVFGSSSFPWHINEKFFVAMYSFHLFIFCASPMSFVYCVLVQVNNNGTRSCWSIVVGVAWIFCRLKNTHSKFGTVCHHL